MRDTVYFTLPKKPQKTVYRFPCFDAEYTLIAAAREYLKQEKHKKSP